MASMLRKAAIVLAAGLVLGSSSGCFTAAGQAYQSIKGADGRVWMHQPIKPPLYRFTTVRIEKFGCEMEGGVPSAILQQLEPTIKQYLLEEALVKNVEIGESGGAGTDDSSVLVLRGVMIDYDPGAAAGRLFGVSGERFLTARVHFLDGRDGSVLGVGHIAGVVKGEIGRDMLDTCKGMAKGIAGVLEDAKIKREAP